MKVDKLYRQRFEDEAKRKEMWKILVGGFFQSFIRKNDVVLDVPCGYCGFINNVVCRRKYAVDINVDSRKRAVSGVTFILSSAEKMALKSGSVDKIFVSNFFEHLERHKIERVVGEFNRVLRKGGLVMVLQPNIRFCAADYWMFFDHITPIDDRGLDELFSLKGFGVEKKILRFLPYTAKNMSWIMLPLLRAYLKIPLLWIFFGKQSFILYKKP